MNGSNETSNEGTGGSVTVPTNEQNPLLQRLTPKQFNASVHFYDADKQLTTKDREEIANDLGKVVTRTAVSSYLSGIVGFFGLTGYKRLTNPRRGLSVLPDPLRPGRFVHQPFLSFLIGLTTMIVTNEAVGRYQFNSKCQQLQGTNNNQYKVWEAMDHHQASLFFLYYKRTSEDSSFILKDPRTFTEKSLHEVHYRPPMKKSHKDSVLGRDDNRQQVNPATNELSHWEQIRIANGFVSDTPGGESKGNSSELEHSDEQESNDPESNEQESNKPKSAWEKIRQNKQETK